MATMNISLSQNQIDLVDKLKETFGFATRSEFFRHLLRTAAKDTKVLESGPAFGMQVTPKGKKVSTVVNSFRETGGYSDQFLKDLEAGLRDSDYFVSD